MKIELKNIKHFAHGSQETNCYVASLYIDGKKVGTAENDGHGGPDLIQGDREAIAAAEKWVAENTPRISYEGKDLGPNCLECYLGDILTNHLIAKDLKRNMKSKAVVVEADNRVRHWGWKGCRAITERHLASIRPKLKKGDRLLNDMPIEDAVKVLIDLPV